LKRNILANYVSQIYVTLIGIVMVPFYVRYMGTEAYGLVGFFAMMQAWFQLLDMGLTPTMARATARYNGGASSAAELRQLLRVLEFFFVGVGFLGATVIFLESGLIAAGWLKVQTISLSEVRQAVMLMGLIISLRWTSGLYRGAINGFERMVWLGAFNFVLATARFVFVIPLFFYVGAKPAVFFIYQLVIAVIELTVLIVKTYSLLPSVDKTNREQWDWGNLRQLLRFSLSIAFTSSVWVLVTQTDKLVLSKLLPLTDYAYFTLAVLVASGVTILSGPVSTALLPRLTNVAGNADDRALFPLYSQATQLVGAVTVPTSLVLALFSEQVLWAWTGDALVARHAAPVLSLYAAGNGILTLAAFPYYLQYAKGDMKLHLVGNAIFVAVLIPVLVYTTSRYGVFGAGCAWFVANLTYFLLWVPVVHRRFKKNLHGAWLTQDVALPLLTTMATGIAVRNLMVWPQNRWAVAAILICVGMLLVISSLIASGRIRERILVGFVRRPTQI
jgi:O-antigen/teichoic acid export membrane protein